MTVAQRALPPAKLLQHTLCSMTEMLADELGSPASSAPQLSEFEWIVSRAVAVMHGVAPLMSHRLRWQGPPAWTEFLAAQRAHTIARHSRMFDLLHQIAVLTAGQRLGVVALKGCALHEMELYAPGDRPMADIDLLVRPADTERMSDALQGLGFHQINVTWKERLFMRTDASTPRGSGEHADNPIKIELHERICERLPWRLTDISEHIFSKPLRPGINCYPSKAALLLHLVLHASGSMAYQSLRLLQLHDIALLSGRMTMTDWLEFLGMGDRERRLWWAYPALRLLSRYYSQAVPESVLEALVAACPRLLRRVTGRKTLYDVSYSYLWVDALPGIEWSQSLRETVDYVASRVSPNRVHRTLRAKLARSEAWAKYGEWQSLSQRRRVLRWMTSRQVRSLTMHSVAAALSRAL